MKREWKPGDMAMVNNCTRPERPWEPAMCTVARTSERETTWRLLRSGREVWGSVSEARPLVVIDPEDREQVERLLLAYGVLNSPGNLSRCIPNMQDALREFANPTPPKPDEPMGLGAVVEDAEGYRFVRGYEDEATHPWHIIDPAARKPRGWWKWDEIDAVRVLSEGVAS